MSWLQRLDETYTACFGQPQFAGRPLAPVGSVMQRTHFEITLLQNGAFASATLDVRETIMFVTEGSAARSGTLPPANPLTEQLEYCARGMERFGGDPSKHNRFIKLLEAWHDSNPGNVQLEAVLRYVRQGSLLDDLIQKDLIKASPSGLDAVRVSKKSKLDPFKMWVRWRVECDDDVASATWEDSKLQRSWHEFEQTLGSDQNLCMLSGQQTRTTQKHPKNIRAGGDDAKLISANDRSGYTYRGRFFSSPQALTIGYESTQRAHNALRWLIERQGRKHGDLVVVAWSVGGTTIPAPAVDSLELLSEEGDEPLLPSPSEAPRSEEMRPSVGDAGQAFARRLNKRMQGFRAQLGEREGVVVMMLDSATPGRMAILYYRDLRGSEFLDRIEAWHNTVAWPQKFGKEKRFTGAPAPRDIAEAAYGPRVDEKLRKATVERLLPCILDGRPLPRDLEHSVVRRAINRAGMERWEFERTLGIACSLVRATHPEKNYTMNLEENRLTRDYLYGRLLAIADSIEEIALRVAREDRETNAARLMQRFADHPATTWRTLELQLRPYIGRLRASRPPALAIRQRLMDQIVSSFPAGEDGNNTFNDNHRLSGEFLLAFHSQREALRSKPSSTDDQGDTE